MVVNIKPQEHNFKENVITYLYTSILARIFNTDE